MNRCFVNYAYPRSFFPTVFVVLIGHDARIAPSSDSKNVSKISSSDMHIYSSQVLTGIVH